MSTSIKPILDQFNNLFNSVNAIPNDKLLSNHYALKKQCNAFKKYVSIDKLIIEIFQINHNYYISKSFINLLTYDKSCFMQLYRHIDENLFSLPRRDLLKQNKSILNDSISINYNGFNIELWNINLKKLTNLNEYDLQIINYQSDIEKIKQEYDNKINILENKNKELENKNKELSNDLDKLNKRLVNILTIYKYHELNNVQKYNYEEIKEKNKKLNSEFKRVAKLMKLNPITENNNNFLNNEFAFSSIKLLKLNNKSFENISYNKAKIELYYYINNSDLILNNTTYSKGIINKGTHPKNNGRYLESLDIFVRFSGNNMSMKEIIYLSKQLNINIYLNVELKNNKIVEYTS